MNLSMVALSTSRSTVAAAAASEVKRVFHLLNPVFEVSIIDPVLCLAETRRKRYFVDSQRNVPVFSQRILPATESGLNQYSKKAVRPTVLPADL